MCQSKADGGARCQGTPFGRSLYALYKERKNSTEASTQAITERIESLKDAERLYGTCVRPHDIAISDGLNSLLDSVRAHGNPLIVGGAVRDSLLGAENKDIDVEVHGVSIDDLVTGIRAEGFYVDEVGKQFGVLKVSKPGVISDIDMSVPRRENKVGAGHRGFAVEMDKEMTVSEAAERRDFTFNAISYDPLRKVIVDPHNGVDDLERKVLRHVGPAFAEDPLRVLRAFQLAGRFDLEADHETAKLCKSLRDSYKDLSVERVTDEWEKFYLKATHPLKGVKLLQDTGWSDTLPGLSEALLDARTHVALSRLPEQSKEERIVLGAASIARFMNHAYRREFVKTTVLGSKPQKLALTLANLNPAEIRSAYKAKSVARDLGPRQFTFALYERYAQMVEDEQGIKACRIANEAGVTNGAEPPLVMGRDIIQMTDRKPGPWISDLMESAYDEQIRSRFAHKEDAMAFVKRELKLLQ